MEKRKNQDQTPADRNPAAEIDDFAAEMADLLLAMAGRLSLLLGEMNPADPGYDRILQMQEEIRRATLRIAQFRQRSATLLKEGLESPSLPAGIDSGAETILLVDDDQAVLDVTRDMLEMMGYRVLTASSGAAAARICQAEDSRIDLVILDMILADMEGGDVFDELHAIRPGLPVILASGFSLNNQVRRVMDKGCRAFLQKPFGMAELSRKLREVLDGTNK